MSLVTISLNGNECQVESGVTILEAARRNGVVIPTLCNDDQLEPFTSCWVCAVKLEGMRRYVPSCGTLVRDGMKIWTDSEDVLAVRRMALELLLSNHRGDCVAPCKAACPASVDVQGYIALIAQGQHREAVKLIKEVNPFPLSIGRVCTRPCESDCRRNAVDGPVGIDYLKRFAADWDISHDDPYTPEVGPATGKRVAAVGAGPASLTLAYYLLQKGHAVTIFEALPAPGGMLRYGIPEYRLPKTTLDREIDLITGLGAEVKYGQALGRDFKIGDLMDRGHDAVFLGLGAMGSRKMKVEGEELDGVWAGTEFLKKMGLGEEVKIGRHVAVIGGGNTAIDAARTSLRLGAEKVTVVYRRSRAEMPAWDVEVEAALHEGVEMHFLAAPTRIEGDGRCERLEYIRMELGEPDDSGRRRPVPVEGSEEILEVDNVIAAIGQVPDLAAIDEISESCPDALECKLELTRWGTIVADERTGATSVDRVFAGGDVVTGAATAIEAIAAGGRAARSIDRMLKGLDIETMEPYFNIQKERWDAFPEEELADVEPAPRQEMEELSVDERIRTFDEVELGYTEEQALAETQRCLECGCIEGFTCRLRQYSAEYGVSAGRFGGEVVSDPPDVSHPFIRLEPEKCILCGRCVRICEEVQGAEALGFFRRGFVAQMKPGLDRSLAETTCEACGQCVSSCPTAALSCVVDLPKPGPWSPDSAPSTCCFCGTGCAISLNTVGERLVGVAPVSTGEDGFSNLCVRGRFGHFAFDERLTAPSVRGGGSLEECSWTVADEAVRGIAEIAREHGPDSVAFFLSPRLTNEEAHRIVEIARDGLGTSNIGSFGLAGELGLFGALESSLGVAASTASYDDLESAEIILLFDCDIAEQQTVLGVRVRRAVRNGARLVVVSPERTRLARIADSWLATDRDRFGDVLLSMIDRALSRIDASALPNGVSGVEELRELAGAARTDPAATDVLVDAADRFLAAGRGVVVANASSFEPELMRRDASLAVAFSVLTGTAMGDGSGVLFMRAKANGQGLSDVGVAADVGELLRGIESGRVRGAVIVGEDPVGGASDPERVREALAGLRCLVVADLVPTGTTALAHCAIPLAAPWEVEGSFTSSERRVGPVNGPLRCGGGLSNLEIIDRLGVSMGIESGSTSAADIRSGMAATGGIPGFPSGALPPGGIRWGEDACCDDGPETADGRFELSIPAREPADICFDPRWTDPLETRLAAFAEGAGLESHVIRRYAVKT